MWSQWTSSSTPVFSFAGLECDARLLDVHDGDTVTVAAEVFPGRFYQLSIRLAGIDAPEMTSKDAELKKRAEIARGRLVQLLAPDIILNLGAHLTRNEMRGLLQKGVPRMVFLKCQGMDKYGRVLAEISKDDATVHAGKTLIDEGLVKAYDGGTKGDW